LLGAPLQLGALSARLVRLWVNPALLACMFRWRVWLRGRRRPPSTGESRRARSFQQKLPDAAVTTSSPSPGRTHPAAETRRDDDALRPLSATYNPRRRRRSRRRRKRLRRTIVLARR